MRLPAIMLCGLVSAVSARVAGGARLVEDKRASLCADLNGDQAVNVGDPVVLLRWLFFGGPRPPCKWAQGSCGDVNGDNVADLLDVRHLLDWLFLGEAEITCAVSCEHAVAPDIDGFSFVECNAQGYPEYTHDQTGIVFVRLPGGVFRMGSPEDEIGRGGDEGPVHEVTLSPFLIAKYEVTQGQWAAVMGDYPSHFDGTVDDEGNPVDPPDDRDRLPVDSVSWDHDIQEFEARTGVTLPTEAQWEYACRGGTETAFCFGAGLGCMNMGCGPCEEAEDSMWYCGNAGLRPHEVGTKAPNPFGLHDMHGNVWEWCEDFYSSRFYSFADASGPDPLCTWSAKARVFRGGRWRETVAFCRSAFRGQNDSEYRYVNLGFRPASPSP